MKLYTEEQVKDMLKDFIGKKYTDYYLSRYYTPIELPSDEEINNYANDNVESISFVRGAKWMRDKIQGVNDDE